MERPRFPGLSRLVAAIDLFFGGPAETTSRKAIEPKVESHAQLRLEQFKRLFDLGLDRRVVWPQVQEVLHPGGFGLVETGEIVLADPELVNGLRARAGFAMYIELISCGYGKEVREVLSQRNVELSKLLPG